MHQRVDEHHQTEVDEDRSLIDIVFILLLTLLFALAVTPRGKNHDDGDRFAVPYGPGAGIVQLDEDDYDRKVTVSLDAEIQLAVNGTNVSEGELLTHVVTSLAEQGNETNQVIYNADPTISHGDAEHVHLLLLQNGFTVLKEYEEIENENH